MQNEKERTSLTKPMDDCDLELSHNCNVHIIDFATDDDGHWFAKLSCGHTQHLRHQPPWQNRAWVQDAKLRTQMIGKAFACGWCAKEQSHDFKQE